MKQNKIFNLLALVLLLFASAACSKEDIVFDHELPQFPVKDGNYLLEVIMPQATVVDEDIYIVGAFNGGNPETVVGDMRYKLEKCENNNVKWGIYLNPADFVDGKTLADGYTFYNVKQGIEKSLKNEDVLHTEAPALGDRINVTVDRWAAYFIVPEDPAEIEHDGYVIYVSDKTTEWPANSLHIYAWSDGLPNLFGDWPGAAPTGTVELNGTTWKYFDTGDANKGLNYNIIFNNGEGGGTNQFDGPNVILDRDYYFTITDGAWEEVGLEPEVEHDGYAIFCINNTGWEEIAMYAWGDGLPNLFGDWPGVPPTGTQKINGVEYIYWDCGEANNGLKYHFIPNNNNNGKQIEDKSPDEDNILYVTLDKDHYFILNADLSFAVVDPKEPPVIEPVDPQPVEPEPEKHPYTIYVNNTLGWTTNNLYAYGDSEIFGAWPGKASDGTKEIDGATYQMFNYEGAGETYNLIINDGTQQKDGPAITADKDYYFKVTEAGWEAVEPVLGSAYKIYVDDQTGWEAIALYAWGDKEIFGKWPGVTPTGTVTEGGITFKYFEVVGNGETEHLIFNNNDGGIQHDNFDVVLDRDYWLRVTAEGVTEISKP